VGYAVGLDARHPLAHVDLEDLHECRLQLGLEVIRLVAVDQRTQAHLQRNGAPEERVAAV
jgi:hypothetical protein